MKVSKNTWHYTLYSMGSAGFNYRNEYHINRVTDLCNYVRNMLLGCLLSLIIVIISTVAIVIIVDSPISLFLYLITDNGLIPFINKITFIIGNIIYAFTIICITLWFFIDYLELRIPKSITNTIGKSESIKLMKTGYKSFKDKTCVLIEVNE